MAYIAVKNTVTFSPSMTVCHDTHWTAVPFILDQSIHQTAVAMKANAPLNIMLGKRDKKPSFVYYSQPCPADSINMTTDPIYHIHIHVTHTYNQFLIICYIP